MVLESMWNHAHGSHIFKAIIGIKRSIFETEQQTSFFYINVFLMLGLWALDLCIYWQKLSRGVHINICTFMTKRSSVGWVAAVAGKTIGSLNAAALVLTERAIAAAVARASRLDPWGDLCPLLQVQTDAVQLQRADAAQKALLSGRSASCQQN